MQRLNCPFSRLVEKQPRHPYRFCKYPTNLWKTQISPGDEKHPLHPVDVNGINKIAGEQYHILYHEVYGVASSVLRLTNTYGPE